MSHSLKMVFAFAFVLQFGLLAVSAQTNIYFYTGSETNISLPRGIYDITAYGAQGGTGQFGPVGGLGAEVEGQFSFSTATRLTLLVGGGGGSGPSIGDSYYNGGGGGGGSFVVSHSFFGNDATPLVIAGGGGGGGGGNSEVGGDGGTSQSGQAGSGSYGGVGGMGGSGGGIGTFFGTASGGGGFYSSGTSGYYGGGGSSFLSGGEGGSGIYNGYLTGGFGGFGGGAGGGYGYCAGGGGGGYSGGGGGDGNQFDVDGGGGGGGSYIDSSALNNVIEVSGVASPDGSPNGEIIIVKELFHITTTSLPNGTNQVAYYQELGATGGIPPFYWSLSKGWPPSGIQLSSRGVIRGTPMTNGTFEFQVKVRDSAGASVIKQLTLIVRKNSAPIPPIYFY